MNLFDGPAVVLDGGLATELERRGNDLSDALWSARLLADAPDEITAAHRAFFRAGARVATTATYQASFDGFAARGIEHAAAERLMRRAVELADAARADLPSDGKERWIAASAGPYGAALADGSEYRGRYGLSVAELAEWHSPRLDVLCDAGADVLALETVPDADEAEALVQAIAGRSVPAWLTYTIDGERTRAGQPLAEAFAVVAESPDIVAVGVNCCAPTDVEAAITIARTVTDKPVLAYPNSGEGWVGRHWTGRSTFDADLAKGWLAAGANAVGGCCRVTPDDISRLADAVRPD
ncbi:homocysteine S-methyltransferase [Solicola gregarius]|uniref:Homocysteine S-methyltransferase n=1 Tax=Solicola gregarius TaxID=2908642 RepID=A0AA46TGV4_9ACTN|nr:homocysteine S-methyltransferase [Solicola gregarius]UYM04896.1 homocysteine S-methyltransferase [Solicola gregarius]